MSENVDRLLDRWLDRLPEARTVHRFDAQYRAQFTFMRRAFVAMDMAMEDEGIPESTRLRIIQTLTYGAPDEAEALARMDRRAAEVAKLAPASMPLVPRDGMGRTKCDDYETW